MSTTAFPWKPRIPEKLELSPIPVPPPDDLEEAVKGPWWQRMIPGLMMVLMLVMIIIIFRSGSRNFSPYMLMMPIMMAMGALGYLGVGGHGNGNMGEVDQSRKLYFLQLRELRKEVHARGGAIHRLHRTNFPSPAALPSQVGRDTMWTAVGSMASKDEDGPPMSPYLMARVGVGLTRMWPALQRADIQIPENMEPLTTIAHTQFIRNQNFIPNTPIGVSLREFPIYAIVGNQNMAAALGRSMITSLAFNHSPEHLSIGIISDPLDGGDWDWLKWLPHVQDAHRFDAHGNARLAWRNLNEFSTDMSEVLSARGPRGGKDDGPAPHYIIFIDTPESSVSLPSNIPDSGIAGFTFVILRSTGEPPCPLSARFHVGPTTRFSTSRQKGVASPDQISILDAEVIAQKMSKYRPRGWAGTAVPVDTSDEVMVDDRTYFDVLGISDINRYDPRGTWRENTHEENIEIPIGFRHDGTKTVNELVTLDFSETARGGTGPHGLLQGMSGSGKSFMLTGIVMSLCAKYGPEKLNLILMDFKGGSTFSGFEVLPHVVANITNLNSETDLVARAGDVLEGEIMRREEYLKQHGVKDIYDYWKLSEDDPITHPPLPVLIIVADEFAQFMNTHREYLQTFIKIGAVGRSLGMHILLASQFIDTSLIRDLMEHIFYGISLRASNDTYSRNVIGTSEATKLPSGTGQAIIKKSDQNVGETRDRFVSFDVERRYSPPKAETVEVIDGEVVGDIITQFTLSNRQGDFEDEAQRKQRADAARAARTGGNQERSPENEKMKRVLISRLSQFDEITALELWKPPLRAPITFADVLVEQAQSSRLEFRIGDIDAPRDHQRYAWTVRPESGRENILIYGRGHSGRSTLVQAMVSSSAMAYPSRMVSWYLIDYGGTKLSEVAEMPNVGGYAAKSDTAKIERFIGEAFRVRDFRERAFYDRGVSSLDAYFASRETDPADEDPYGHMFLVIDGFSGYLKDNDEEKMRFQRLLDSCGRYGVHVVATIDDEAKLVNLLGFFGEKIYLGVGDVTMITGLPSDLRAAIRNIPDQPGRAVDSQTGLAALVLVPQAEKIVPVGFDSSSGNDIFDPDADYSPGIRGFAAAMRQSYIDAGMSDQLAPVIETVPAVVPYVDMWSIYDAHKPIPATPEPGVVRRKQIDIHMPLAISSEDLTLVPLPDDPSPHLIVVGDPKSGKTSALRSLLNSIVRQMGPDEAQIVLAESRYALLPEKEMLEQMGYLMGYATSKAEFDTVMESVADAIGPRIPTLDMGLTVDSIQNRSWYDGPEVFVLIDNLPQYGGGMGGGMGFGASATKSGSEILIELITARPDLGLHVYATGPAQNFSSTRETNKLYAAMGADNTPVVMMSGQSGGGQVFPRIKFRIRRPGEGLLYRPESESAETVQLGYAETWNDPRHAPPVEIVSRAVAIKATMPERERPAPAQTGEPAPDQTSAVVVQAEPETPTDVRPNQGPGRKWGDY